MPKMFLTFAEYKQANGNYIVVLRDAKKKDIKKLNTIQTYNNKCGINTYNVCNVIEQEFDGDKYLFVTATK